MVKLTSNQWKPIFRDPTAAFKNALNHGLIHEIGRPESDQYHVANWMYMHTEDNGTDAFKNIDTRRYIYIPNKSEV